MMPRVTLCFLWILCAAAMRAATTDDVPDTDPPAPGTANSTPPTPAPGAFKIGGVTITGTDRARFYDWNWFQPATGQNQYEYYANLLRINLAERFKTWDWDAEFEVPMIFGLPTHAVDAAPQGALGLGANDYSSNHNSRNSAFIFPKQLYVHFSDVGSEASKLQLGRFVFLDGSETTPQSATLATLKASRIAARLIGDFGFSDVGRSFDGLHYNYTKGSGDFTFIAAVPTRGVFQTDGWGWNRIGFGYAAYTRDWGSGAHAADTRLFVIEYDDFRHILKTDNRPTAVRKGDLDNIRINTFGAHSLHAFTTSAGILDALLWGVVQTGRWGTEQQHSYAFALEGGYQPKILPKLKPWFRGGYSQGSGDGNPNDNKHETFFQILPTPRLYARFPFFNMMNTEDGFGSLMLRPHPKVTVTSEYHSLRLTSANDFWYSGGGAYQPWTFGYTGRSTSGRRSLGNLYDTQVDYRVTRKITATAYIGYTQGLAALQQIYPGGKDGQFGYLEFMYRF
jgi:hypothetical protein